MAFPLKGIFHGTRHVKDPDHGFFVLNGLSWMQKEEKFCDVILKIGEERKLRAHRVVLALSSRYFEALLGTNWEESRSEEIELLGFDENAVTNLVTFAYSGAIDITKDNVQFLLEAANYLGIEFVQRACTDFILDENLDADTCLGALQIADMFALESLKEEAKHYALRHFTEISIKQDFVNLPHHLLCELLSNEFLCTVVDDLIPRVEERERVVIQAVFRYVEHDRRKRAAYLPDLLSLVRLPTLSRQHLKEIARHSLIRNCQCEDILDKALRVKSNVDLEADSSTPNSNWGKSRDFAKCTVTWSSSFASTHHDFREISVFTDKNVVEDNSIDDLSEGVYINGITVWARYLEDKQVISGLEVFYSDNRKTMYGVKTALKQNEVKVKENEKIVKVDVQAGAVINGLTFYTNKRDMYGNMKTYQGFHSDYRHRTHDLTVHTERPIGFYGFLAGVAGAVVDFHGQSAITRLQFAWKTFFHNDGIPIPEHLIGKCKIGDNDGQHDGDNKSNDGNDDDDDNDGDDDEDGADDNDDEGDDDGGGGHGDDVDVDVVVVVDDDSDDDDVIVVDDDDDDEQEDGDDDGDDDDDYDFDEEDEEDE